ncbi:hypothetical protein CMT41_18105 [Colwellia sp. MT41]|uniref:hypothetical protein n=1 Tax=Colwellia sp. MT41 TaxID=58049 RepID=UPI000717A532|nr:hypothetical protein [Colwellia sp. MT41]ALO36443.1 hypothetical protein CMT41_18105 [Colwellia sp. MT41]
MNTIKIIYSSLFDTAISYCLWLKLKTIILLSSHDLDKGDCVLLFSNFPPEKGGGIFRPHSWVKYIPDDGLQIKVITLKATAKNTSSVNENMLKELPKNSSVTYVYSDISPSYKLFPKSSGSFIKAILMALKAIYLYKKTPPKKIIASGPEFSYFIAAYYTSLYFDAPLIIDYRDEWTLCPFDFVSKEPGDSKWETVIQKHANKIIFTTRSQLISNGEHFGKVSFGKSIVIPNGWDDSDLNKTKLKLKTQKEHLNLCFFGNFAEHSVPQAFLEVLTEINKDTKIILSIIGSISECMKKTIANYEHNLTINIYSQIPINEVLDAMNLESVDALILISNKELSNYLPGKIFYYLASKKPILLLGVEGESQYLVETLKAGILCPLHNKTTVKKALSNIASSRIPINDDERQDWARLHTRRQLAKNLYQLLK